MVHLHSRFSDINELPKPTKIGRICTSLKSDITIHACRSNSDFSDYSDYEDRGEGISV